MDAVGKQAMLKFDHLRIPVTDLSRSRDWYIRTLGLKVRFEVPTGIRSRSRKRAIDESEVRS